MKKINYNMLMRVLFICLIVLIVALFFFNDELLGPNMQEIQVKTFERCVSESGLKLYGRDNSQVFLAQKEELGELFEKIEFVDCLENRSDCQGILLIPAWEINQQIYYGSFSINVLMRLMECEEN